MQGISDEHRMLGDSLQSLLDACNSDTEIWPGLARLGMLGLTLPEAAGGAGLGLAELLLFARAFGRAGVSTPFLAAEVLAMPLLAELPAHPAVAPLLGDLGSGRRIVTLALEDRRQALARPRGDGEYVLSGVKTLVPSGAGADLAIVVASLSDAPALFLVDLATAGVDRTPYVPAAVDAGADLAFADVALTAEALLAKGDDAAALIADARARGQLATAAGMLGAMEALLDLTLDYLRTRQQFGQPLSAFQVLQHAAVDMYVELETARAMLDYGTRMFSAPSGDRDTALDAVKLKMNGAAKSIGESAVQLHGGIGMTRESLTGRLFARFVAERLAFGDSRSCMNRLMARDASIALS
jgi:alkylation response protein AidB-like acyl-CoA dehydrogenase